MKPYGNNGNIKHLLNGKAKTRKEIASELGISTTTLWRKLKTKGLDIPSGLIYPNDQIRIYLALGVNLENNESY